MAKRHFNVEEICWLSGLFDGEGSIYIARRKPTGGSKNISHVLETKVNMACEKTIRKIGEIVGYGAIRKLKKYEGRKQQWQWACSSNDSYKFLKIIKEHSITKKNEIDLGIEFQERMYMSQPSFYRLPQRIVNERDIYYWKMRDLKKDGVPCA